jgi:hypothetical protein
MATFATEITTAKVKEYYNIPALTTDRDAYIAVMLQKAIDQVCQYCGHDFESKARASEEVIVDKNSIKAFLDYRPVASVESVIEDGDTLISGTDYYTHKAIGCIERLEGEWNSIPGKLVVSYTGGVALNQDVVQVVMELIGIYAGLKVRTYVTNEGIEQSVTITSIPKDLKERLDLYRYVRV